MDEEKMPLFLINGFLEAGKTQFIRFTLNQDYFRTEGRTLLLVCEEGEEEYDEQFLKDTRTDMIVIDDQETVTPEYLSRLAAIYKPERVLMEWNGMWDITKLTLPDDWDLYQQITIVDGSTFDLYVGNNDLKSLLGVMVRSTEMLIMNRCDGIEDKLGGYYRVLKGMNRNVFIMDSYLE